MATLIKSYRDLEVWQIARGLVKDIYVLSEHFPPKESFGLTQQIRRAAISVVSNIAEGHSRSSTRDFIQFISISIGSLAEIDTQLIVAQDLNYVSTSSTAGTFDRIYQLQRMLHGLRNKLKGKLS